MKYIHPAYRFMLADLAEIDLGCFEILMSQDNLGHDFQLKGLIIGGLSDLTLSGSNGVRGLIPLRGRKRSAGCGPKRGSKRDLPRGCGTLDPRAGSDEQICRLRALRYA